MKEGSAASSFILELMPNIFENLQLSDLTVIGTVIIVTGNLMLAI